MSKILAVEVIGILGAIFFSVIVILLILIKLTIRFQNILKNGITPEVSPSLWIMIPILTLLGIIFTRLTLGFEHNFHQEAGEMFLLVLGATIVSLQLVFGKLGCFLRSRTAISRPTFSERSSRFPVLL